MNSCGAVEKELERVITKFTAIRGHSERVLNDVGVHLDDLKESINEGKIATGKKRRLLSGFIFFF